MEENSQDKPAEETPRPSEKKDIWKPLRDLGIIIVNDTHKMVGKTTVITINKPSKKPGDKESSE
jgi:hypothetical protein